MKVNQKRLKELLTYDPNTGVFTWKVLLNKWRKWKNGVAGYITPDRYLTLTIDGKIYQIHRLAFLYMEGFFPEHKVDHKDGNGLNNKWSNLRHVTQACNLQNQKMRTNNKSGFPGVSYNKRRKKWQASIRIRTKLIGLGCHDTGLDAALTRLTFELQCDMWNCDHQGALVKAIKKAWPKLNDRSLK